MRTTNIINLPPLQGGVVVGLVTVGGGRIDLLVLTGSLSPC
jgi:hypothetical protein